MKKKRNGWKTAFLILAGLILLFILSVLFSDDEEDSYEYEDSYTEAPVSSSESGALQSADDSAALPQPEKMTVDDVLRDTKVTLKGNGEDTVTILLYMNGSDLESQDGEATEDLSEMVKAGSSDKVNFLVQTMNTKKWGAKYGISSKKTQRFKLDGNGLTLVDDSLSQLSCAESKTLEDFIKWGVNNYPADRYILLFWDHGGGPIYGFGYDDISESEDSLSTDEIQTALKNSGAYFDFIGMDCCIMSCMEFCCSLYDYCDYTLLSEDFESGFGWTYTNWLNALYQNTSISTPDLSKIIIDDMVKTNESSDEAAILALIDESCMKVLYTSWLDFAYANEDSLLGSNYSRKMTRHLGGRIHPTLLQKGFFSDFFFGYGEDEEDYALADYYVTDIMAVAGTIDSDESKALEAALNKSIVYMNSCGNSSSLTGLSVTLPYGDPEFYGDVKKVFTNCGFDETYVNWLEKFAGSSNYDSFYDYEEWDDEWNGWDDYEDDYDWDYWGSDFGSNWDDEYWDYYYDDCYGYDCYSDDCGDDYYYDDYYDYYYDDYYYDDWFGWSDWDW